MTFKTEFCVNGQLIGENRDPFIIAEMSANHANKLEVAIDHVKMAKECGAHAIKLQTYTADTLTLNCRKKAFEASGAWKGTHLYDLYAGASMPWEWTETLQAVAKEVDITLFSTPFDSSSVEFLEKLNMPMYKIASPEMVDLPLVRMVAKTQKPIILSTGGATFSQIEDAVKVLQEENVNQLIILKCTSEYPAPPNKINLKTISDLKNKFKCVVGLSDHTLGTSIPIASVALGAAVIEKHFIINKKNKTADSFFSASPSELKEIVVGTKLVKQAIGTINYPEKEAIQRSLIAIQDIKKGDVMVNGKNFKSLRPGGGIPPKFLGAVENKIASKTIKFGTLLSWDLLEDEL